MSYEKIWAEENKGKNRGSMNIIMDMEGNSNYITPRPNSKVGVNSDAKEILKRNRGGTGCIFGNGNSQSNNRTGSRIHGYEAEEIYDKGKNGTMASVLNLEQNKGYTTSRSAPRVKPEAEAIALKNSNGTMGCVLDSNKNVNYYPVHAAGRCVKQEAESNFIKGKGTMSVILNNNSNYNTARGKPRVKPEAQEIALMNKGTMNVVLSSSNKPDEKPMQRIKPEAVDIYNTNKGTLSQMYCNYGNLPLTARPAPKVKSEGQEIERYGRQGSLCFLLTKYGNLPHDGKPPARVKSEAKRFAKQGQGSIADILGTKKK